MSAISDRVLESTLDRDVFSATLVTDDVNYDRFVLSYGQQRLWFLQQLEPNSAAYNIPVALRLRGRLNRAALKKSLWEIVRRHESLRTTFSVVDGEPVQVIAAVPAFSLAVTYLSHLPLTEREAEAQREAMAEAQQSFNLSEGPLFRARLLKLGADEHVLLLSLHHIIGDGWSMGVLFKELSALYNAFCAGQPSPLAELPVQYADYAVWQREWLSEEVLEAQVKYWREQLRGAPAVLELPTDRPRPAVQSYRGLRHRMELEEELTSQLKELSRREGVTLFMTLLAAFQVLLWRYTGQQDFVVGTPTAGRSRAEIEPLIGFFLNTLALRTELSGQRTFREVLQGVKQVCLEAYAHQDLPFDRLVDELGLERNLRQSPLVQVTFNLSNREEERLTLSGLKTERLRNFEPGAKFDLTLNATEHDQRLALNFIFNPDLFESATIERLSKHFRQLLTGIVADPAQPASKLTVLSAGERQQVLKEWNDTRTEYATDLLVHEMFEQQAARTPESIALVYEQERFSYRELNEQANRLGHYLRQQGVGPESVVGILLERSAEMVTALLATLKAGGAYLPLDPGYPEERLRLMLADAGTRVLLTSTELAHKIGAEDARQLQVLKLDSAGPQLAQQSAANVPRQVTADNLAYVIYTSGSTGTPKAAMNTHDAIRNRLLWMQQAYGLSAADCVLQKTPYSFDVSVWEFFWPLMYGARLAVARPGGHQDAEYLREVIAAERVTTLHFVPSMLSVFLQHGDFERCRTLRQVICSGEALSLELVERFFRHLSWARLHNLYGPTEAAVDVSYWDCSSSIGAGGLVPIGQPIANTQLYVLDDQLEPVGIKTPGELYIGGVGVGRGYWRRPDLTAERFIPDPHGDKTGARLYRTGDRACYREDGNIEFLGRVDYQVKLRGQRIELGEIETALRQHVSVGEVVVTVRGSEEDGQRLVAYVVKVAGEAEGSADGDTLHRYLRERLPAYMVPAAFIFLEQMPLTRNGKIDRKALPDPALADGNSNAPFEAPRTPLETILEELWCESLKLAQVSVHANFFEIGGDSLKGAVFINKLQRRLGEVLYVVALFDAPTIAALATYLETKYPEGVARLCGSELTNAGPTQAASVTEADVVNLRETIARHERKPRLPALAKNPSAVFILSPPRSGSTLLRVMLGGNPSLFAPPELELLSFDTMSERSEALSGRNAFSLEGAIRAVMELLNCDAEKASAVTKEHEAQQVKVQDFYRQLQQWCGDRRLVDKTPVYALELETLRRAEEYFENPLYVRLLRHPAAMINSFVEAKLDEVFFRYPHHYSTRELAELIWLLSHQNIQTFLRQIPAERQHQVSFEELLQQPEVVARRLSRWLGVEFCAAMIEPYSDTKKRMTDGVHDVSRMHGDMKFFTHDRIDPHVADRWREQSETLQLGDVTVALAASLGYLTAEASTDSKVGKNTAIEVLPRAANSKLQLSFAQQRLWFLDQLQTSSSPYNIAAARELKGPLNVSALAQSLTEIVRRHESLRTTFTLIEEQPLQVIAEPAEFNLTVMDLSQLGELERHAEAQRQAHAEARQPFNLAQGPLFRASLLKLAAEEHVLLLTLHHIIGDGWSIGILLREIAVLYNTFCAGQPSPLAELPVQYADYAVWQREWLSEEVLEAQVKYWREQLRGAPALLELPTDRPRPAAQSYEGAVEKFSLPEELSQKLKELSQGEGVTLFMTLLAAFQVLLSRYSGQKDVVVGTPIAGRTRAEEEAVIGLFVNTLALRVDLSGEPTFRQVLARVRETCLGAYAHQEIPFEKLVQELRPERSLRHSPLFQVFFQLNTGREPLALSGLSTSPFRHHNETAKFDLTLALAERSGGLLGSLEYNSDLFDASTAARLVAHFTTMLHAAAAAPDTPIDALPLLSETERRQVLIDWNDTAREFALNEGVQQLFEQQVTRTPEAVALTSADETLTYRELNERANRLAHYLLQQGVGAESLVGILLERSPEMVISLLAILKAGAAYLPLDPTYPLERLSFMVEDAGVQVLLTREHLVERLPAFTGQRFCFEPESLQELSSDNPQSIVTADNLAYVIYTSGSTGTPKGVGVTRRALTNFLQAMLAGPGLRRDDVLLAVTTLSFDIAALELFLPLVVGARLVVVHRQVAADARQLTRTLEQEAATVMQATPSTWRMLVESGWRGGAGFKSLCGGEALAGDLAEALLQGGTELWNLYGPTETTIWSTAERVESGSQLTIGRGVANTQVYVLDEKLEPVAPRVAGELYIGGTGVARGYLGRAALTAERFVPDAWSGVAGGRVYRTGDVVRWGSDGRLEYLGRSDQQVKVRGHRIEPTEVERALNDHERVRQSVVVARDGVRGEKQLVAYVVAEGAEQLTASELREHARARLPEYMVPNLFVALEQLPLTSNGKVDRHKLPFPESGSNLATQNYTPPRTETERMLCGIWSSVLKVEQVGIHDNFFELGGHSLLATQLVSQMRKVFGVEIALRTIFETPTVAGLAQQTETARAAEKGLQAPPILTVSRNGDLPLSFAQQRLWFLDQLKTSSSPYNISAARRLKGPLNVSALAQSLREIVRRHESLRTTFALLEEQPLQVIAEPGEFNFTVMDLSQLGESERHAEAQRQANAEARRPFNLAQGPLFRARLLKLDVDEHVLLLTLHHIVGDGWSMGVLFKELGILYNAFCAGQPSPLAELTVQYADYAAWQRNYLQGEVLERELEYWRQQLSGAPTLLELPTDRPRPAAQSYEGAVEKFSLPEELSQKLKELSQREGVTLFMTLLAAFQVLLSRYSGQKDVVVGTPIAGRTRAEEEAVIGLFVNTLALRVDLSGEPTFRQVLARVRETCLGAYAHQEIPFEKLVQELRPERSLRHSPLFQVFFQLNTGREPLALSGLELKPLKHQSETAKYDLTLVLNDTPSGGLLGSLEYSTDLFDPATAMRLVTHFTTILSATVAAPETPLHALPILTQSERQQLLQEWNNTGRDFRLSQGIHKLFEQQVERTPKAIALISENKFVSYRELNERANRLAHYLMKRGIGPESLVGVLLERSADMVVALLAVLKAGAAYLPLDTAYPAGRVSLMLEDARAEVVLTHEQLLRLAPSTNIHLICLDAEREQIAQDSTENPITPGTPANLAYAIYTSGSTGRPKGVEITRAALENSLRGMMECFPLNESDVFAAISTLCFDIAALELFVPLLFGGRVLVVSRAVSADPRQLAQYLDRFGVTIMEATPTSWRMLIESGWRGKSELRALCGGEVLTGELAEALLERGCRLWNLYGPTETTLWSTVEPVQRDTRATIGWAVANARLYVVDAWMEPVAIGVTGELYIGGAGVARGYMGDPALTAARFVPDPWSGLVGARLYRTGDLVRWRADRRLEYLGRADQQVKIRGHRIEPVEIEAALNEHDWVRASVVVARDGGAGVDQLLIAYIVPGPGNEEKRELSRVLRQHLQARVPDYMVPNLFVELAQLPLTASGKVDRQALPEPPSYQAETGANYEAPRTRVEEVLCRIWAEVLRMDQVGINDDFFELGGHSLLATRLLARVQNAFEVRLPLRSVFEAPTVLGMAESLFNLTGEHLRIEKTAQALLQLSQISEEEAATMLDMQLVG